MDLRAQLRRFLPRGGFLRSVAVLAGGTALAQAVAVLVAPLLTRLFSPDDFGVLAVFTAVLAVLGIAASLAYELAVPVPQEDRRAANLLVLSLILLAGATVLTAVAAWIWSDDFALWVNTPGFQRYAWLVPVALFGAGAYRALNYWAVRRSEFGLIARTRITQGISRGATSLGLGWLFAGPLGLLVGATVGMVAGTGALAALAWRRDKAEFTGGVTLARIWVEAREYRKFPLFQAPTGLLNIASHQVPSILISACFGAAVLGQYFLAMRIMYASLQLVGQALSQVFYQRAAECRQQGGDLRVLVLKLYRRLFWPALLGGILLFWLAPGAFAWIFGADWRLAGEYVRLILPWLLVMFVVVPSTSVFLVLNKPEVILAYSVVILLLRVLSIIFGAVVMRSAAWAIGLYSLIGVLSGVYMAYRVLYTIAEESRSRP